MNFTISSLTPPLTFSIAPIPPSGSNAIGLYQNHANNPQSNVIINQTLTSQVSFPPTIEQQLLVVLNDGIVGGNLTVAYQVKGTNLPAANTLGSATTDIQFDNQKLTYVSATNMYAGFALGYSAQVTNNSTFVRIGVTSSSVFPTGGGTGFDIAGTYTNWVLLNFTILNTAAPVLTIAPGSNSIGLFKNHLNSPSDIISKSDFNCTCFNISNECKC